MKKPRYCDLCGAGRATVKTGVWLAHSGCLAKLVAALSEAPRWLTVALERIGAGEPEREVFEDYGYKWEP